MDTKHIICFSGGHSSAIVAIEVVRKYGKENVILLNHDISSHSEDVDIKRFKNEVADYLGLPITYANINGITDAELLPDQFDVIIEAETLTNPATQDVICTERLKTGPFTQYLKTNFLSADTLFEARKDCIIYYGFDAKESRRIQRRTGILGAMGYKTDYPMLWKDRTITSTKKIGIEPPNTYSVFLHANCKGCLKAGLLHWYVTYVHAYDRYAKGKLMESKIDFTIHVITRNGNRFPVSLTELEPYFEKMKLDGVPATEHQSAIKFSQLLRTYGLEECEAGKPCECVI